MRPGHLWCGVGEADAAGRSIESDAGWVESDACIFFRVSQCHMLFSRLVGDQDLGVRVLFDESGCLHCAKVLQSKVRTLIAPEFLVISGDSFQPGPFRRMPIG